MECNIFAVNVAGRQEYNVSIMMKLRVEGKGTPIHSIVVLDSMPGLVFVEADAPFTVDRMILGLKHVKGRLKGKITLDEMEKLLRPRPVIEELKIGDEVEIVAGPFKGHRAKVTFVDVGKGIVRVEILDAAFPLPLEMKAVDVKKRT